MASLQVSFQLGIYLILFISWFCCVASPLTLQPLEERAQWEQNYVSLVFLFPFML